MTTAKRLYRVNEFLEAFGIGRTKFYSEVRAGRLRIVRFGERSTRILGDDAENWLKTLSGDLDANYRAESIPEDKMREMVREYQSDRKEAGRVKRNNWARHRYAAGDPDKSATKRRNCSARKRGASGTHTAQDIAEIFRDQGGRCAYYAYCGTGLTRDNTHVDHKVPVSRGGSNGPGNLQLTCNRCNSKKGTKTHEEFLMKVVVPELSRPRPKLKLKKQRNPTHTSTHTSEADCQRTPTDNKEKNKERIPDETTAWNVFSERQRMQN